MNLIRIVIVAATIAFAVAACGSKEPGPGTTPTVLNLTSLPATVEGILAAAVGEGDVDEEGSSEFNFGTLTVGDDELLIQVSGSLLQSAGVPDEGTKVRATLGSKSDGFGAPTYTITSLSRL